MALYNDLVRLDKENKNGVWARIIKNNFAPLFVGRVDYVAGNPPWVNWENLPQEYRQSTAPLWQAYDLFQHKGYKAKLGGAKDDISVLMTYVAHDCYLIEGGSLGFVITLSVFKTKGAGEGFRRFQYRNAHGQWFLPPLSVHDLSRLQPFEGAVNRTATFVVGKARTPFAYPVRYVAWFRGGSGEIAQDDTLQQVYRKTERQVLAAEPIDSENPASPWLTSTESVTQALRKVRGRSDYGGRKGVYCPTNAVYWIVEARPVGESRVLVTNLADSGKRSVRRVTQAVEKDFIYPLIRGKDISRWHCSSPMQIILPQDPKSPAKALPEHELKTQFPKTFSYFKQFESELRSCALLKQFFNPKVDPFYSSYNVGEYTFATYKVLWREVARDMQAAVSMGTGRPFVPDHTLVMVPVGTATEAHYLCALLNSAPASYVVKNYVTLHPATHVLNYLRIRTFEQGNPRHRTLAALSEQIHAAVAGGEVERVRALEAELDLVAAELWGLTDNELKAIQEAMGETGKSQRASEEDQED